MDDRFSSREVSALLPSWWEIDLALEKRIPY
jgi:hypothetical protein